MADMNNLPALEVSDIINALDGVANSHVDETGTTKPLIQCIVSGVLRGAAVLIGSEGSEARDTVEYENLIKKLISNDIVVLAIGYPVSVAVDAKLTEFESKDLASAGLKRVCELAQIPPVLPLGGLDKIENVVTIAKAISSDSGLGIPQLPIVGVDAAAASKGAVDLGNTFMGLGVSVYVGLVSESADPNATAAELGLKATDDAKFVAECSLEKLGDDIVDAIEAKRDALEI